MASLLGSWWGGESKEEEKEEREKTGNEKEDNGDKSERDDKPSNPWVAGIGGLVRNVSEYAATVTESVKNTVQDKSLIGQFQEEQDKFSREKRRQKDAAVPPWVGYNEEEQMKAQILELSSDSRNVLRNPPPGVQFHFNFAKSYPIAMAVLKEDSTLQKLRFDLVPKKISEQKFWHNYFYRVFLIKQSSQLASLSSAEHKTTLSSDHTEEKEGEEGGGGGGGGADKGREEIAAKFNELDPQSPGQEEFASDSLPGESAEISRDSVREELGQLAVATPTTGEGEENRIWEEQLQQELQDLEIQGMEEGGGGKGKEEEEEVDNEAWEAELQEMLDMHSEDPPQD